MRWTRGKLLVGLAASLLMIVGLAVPGDPAHAARRPADRLLNYTCRFPTGERQVQVRIQGTFPEAVTARRSVRPGRMSVALLLPPLAVADLRKLGAGRVSAGVRLTTLLTAPGVAEDIVYQASRAVPIPLDAAGATVATTGELPAIPVADPGAVRLSAGDLALRLALRTARTDKPFGLSVTCTPYLGQDTAIAAIKASARRAGAEGGTVPAIRGADVRAADLVPYCNEPEVPGGYDPSQPMVPKGFNPKWPFPPLLPGTTVNDYSFASNPEQWCADVATYANVRKLKGAARMVGLGSIRASERTVLGVGDLNYFESDAVLISHLDPNRATFLGFGFMPTSATIEVVQREVGNAFAIGPRDGTTEYKPTETTANAEVFFRMRDAEVNGAPLNVGPNCRTARPMPLKLEGSSAADPAYLLDRGGYLEGYVTIPPFTGCGVGDDLDPLLTAAVSGPGNYVRVVQGPTCRTPAWPPPDELDRPNGGDTLTPCPPRMFGFNVSPGGNWTATSTNLALTSGFAELRCATATMGGTLRRGKGLHGVRIGQVTRWEASGCTVVDIIGSEFPGPFQITAQLPWDLVFDSQNPGPGPDGAAIPNPVGTRGHLMRPALRVTGPNCSVDLVDRGAREGVGSAIFFYDSATGLLKFGNLNEFGSVTPVAKLIAENLNGCMGPNGLPLLFDIENSGLDFSNMFYQEVVQFAVTPRQAVTVPGVRPRPGGGG